MRTTLIAILLCLAVLSCNEPRPLAPLAVDTASVDARSQLVLKRFAGDSQSGAPATTVPIPPTVRVTRDGQPVSGVRVIFTIGTGGGTVTGDTAFTDGSGSASVGSWTWGTGTGLKTLVARTATDEVTFVGFARRFSADVAVDVTNPAPNTRFAGDMFDSLFVSASVTAAAPITTVTAKVRDHEIHLVKRPSGAWTGKLSLEGIPHQLVGLTVTATDASSHVTQVVRPLFHDRAPRPVVNSPFDHAVSFGKITIDAACDDDTPGCLISVRRGAADLVVEQPGPIHTEVSIWDSGPSDTSGAPYLLISVRDSTRRVRTRALHVHLSGGEALDSLATIPGEILDIRGTRILYRSEEPNLVDSTITHRLAIIRDQTSGQEDTIETGHSFARGMLTPSGAELEQADNGKIVVYSAGSVTRLDGPLVDMSPQGNYLLWGTSSLRRVNTATLSSTLIASDAGTGNHTVTDSGDVAYWRNNFTVWVRQHDVDTLLTSGFCEQAPILDGHIVVFIRGACYPASQLYCVGYLQYTGYGPTTAIAGNSHSLCSNDTFDFDRQYSTSNGHIAAVVDADGARAFTQKIMRDGQLITHDRNRLHDNAFDLLGRDGAVIFRDDGAPAARIVIKADLTESYVGSAEGRVLWRDGRMVLLLGNSAFAILY
jgi:hypothetical protein